MPKIRDDQATYDSKISAGANVFFLLLKISIAHTFPIKHIIPENEKIIDFFDEIEI